MQAIRDMIARLALVDSAASPRWRMLVTVLGLLLCVIGLAAVVKAWLAWPPYPDAGGLDLVSNTDFDLYILAADNLTTNPYRVDLWTGMDRYGYPPLLADVLAGLKAVLGVHLVAPVWVALCAGALVGAMVLMARGFGAKLGWHWIVLAVGVVFLGRLVRMDLYHGQVNVIVLVLLVGGVLLRAQGRVIAASVAFAVMMSLKPFMGCVVIYFALRADWRMVAWGLGMGTAVFVASFVPTWPGVIEAWEGWRANTHHFTSPPFVTKPDNQSMYGMFLRMFTETKYGTPWINAPQLVPAFMAIAIAIATSLAVLGLHVAGGADRPRIGPKPAVLLLECMMIYALVAFCGPLTEGNHIILALAGLGAALIVGFERMQAWSKNSVLWVAAIIAWALPCLFVVVPKAMWFTLGEPGVWSDVDGWKILLSGRCGLLLLGAGGLTALAMWRERRLMNAQQTAADNRFEAIANRRPAPLGVYRVEDQRSSRVAAE